MATRIDPAKQTATAAIRPKGGVGKGRRSGGNGDHGVVRDVLAVIGPSRNICEQIREQIDRAIAADSIDLLIASLVQVARRKAPAEAESVKAFMFQELLREMDGGAAQRRKLWSWTRYCAARPETEAREIACALLANFWRDQRKDVERLTLNLARDEDSEVRQYAASTMARIVRTNFRLHFRYLQRWSRHSDPSVRRQVIVATAAVADATRPERGLPLLELLEPHLSDRDPFIRRNLGPFALGHGMLGVYPEQTLECCRQWAESDDEIVRWNLAMTFTTPAAPLHAEKALDILRVLASDPRRFVWSAAAVALRNLFAHRPEFLEPTVKRWTDVPALRVAVATALNRSVR